jgi:hypothetical protein
MPRRVVSCGVAREWCPGMVKTWLRIVCRLIAASRLSVGWSRRSRIALPQPRRLPRSIDSQLAPMRSDRLPDGRAASFGPEFVLHESPRLCCILDELINFAADALRLESLWDRSFTRKRRTGIGGSSQPPSAVQQPLNRHGQRLSPDARERVPPASRRRSCAGQRPSNTTAREGAIACPRAVSPARCPCLGSRRAKPEQPPSASPSWASSPRGCRAVRLWPWLVSVAAQVSGQLDSQSVVEISSR